MVPCSRMGEETEEEEVQLAEERIKEQVRLERKEESKLSFQVFFFFPAQCLCRLRVLLLVVSIAASASEKGSLRSVQISFKFFPRAPNLFFNILLYLFIPVLIGAELMEHCNIIWKQC